MLFPHHTHLAVKSCQMLLGLWCWPDFTSIVVGTGLPAGDPPVCAPSETRPAVCSSSAPCRVAHCSRAGTFLPRFPVCLCAAHSSLQDPRGAAREALWGLSHTLTAVPSSRRTERGAAFLLLSLLWFSGRCPRVPVQIPALPLPCCVALKESRTLSGPQFPYP